MRLLQVFAKQYILITILAGLVVLVTPSPVQAANAKEDLCSGAGLSNACAPSCDEDQSAEECVASSRTVEDVVRVGVNLLSFVVGVAAIVMVVLAGAKYITSHGDAGRISSAKQTIIYAIVGLAIVALAQFIVRFTISRSTTDPPTIIDSTFEDK